ncbi:Ni/Fe-hydrogenase, b-type cytochrome subunit [Halioxenophilus aromaticivorans]|uniref:Ni/Fe-hydrogenase, b-type cytochrome subunit n=1 Tax=Halioxenophilus aromaticivorans TaxID=1306992 RepID=A0AAV3U8R7_9ALTE
MQEANTPRAAAVDNQVVHAVPTIKSIYVYEAPIRAWHWINACAMVCLIATGYLISAPPTSIHGEASEHFLFGYIRFIHFASAYIFAIGFLGRVYWAFVGNYHAREMFFIPIFTKLFWRELFSMLRWYLFLRAYPNRYIGHNPIARLSMFVCFVLLGIIMICTGFALYGEGAMPGHIAHTLFTSWVIPLFGSSHSVHTIHYYGMWIMLCFIMLHIYAAIREDILGRQSMVSTMINGYRLFKD